MSPIERAHAILLRQPLIKRGYAWQAKRHRRSKLFSHATIRLLIRQGLARRDGNRVVAMVLANDNEVCSA